MIKELIQLHLLGCLKFEGKKVEIRIIATLQDGNYVFQIFEKNSRELLYQGSDLQRMVEIVLEQSDLIF